MTPQVLDRTLTAWRIGDPDGAWPILSAKGSAVWPGRWNTPDTPMIYAGEHFSTAMLEKLVHMGELPPNQHFVEITIDAGCSYEVFPEAGHPGWADRSGVVSKAYGAGWRREGRSAVLLVPGIVARVERNVLINPDHPDFAKVRAGLHQPVWWDERLFG